MPSARPASGVPHSATAPSPRPLPGAERWKAVAPGRINLIGEHVDYLGGVVMPIAIERYVEVEAWRTETGSPWTCEILPDGPAGSFSPELGAFSASLRRREDPAERWMNYLVGVVEGYRAAGWDVPPFHARIRSTLPVGAGLSSSAALETATALAVEGICGRGLDTLARALLCQRAEHEYAGVPCGLMDQIAAGAGEAGRVLRIDCRSQSWSSHALPPGISVVVADSGVKHALADGHYAQRRAECEEALGRLGANSYRELRPADLGDRGAGMEEPLLRRAGHVLTEMERVERFAAALESGDTAALGDAMGASHRSLRDDFEASCAELDALVEAAEAFGTDRGLVGSRMTGGGFGGSTVSLVRSPAAPALISHLENSYEERFGRKPLCFITRAADGAKLERMA